MVQVTRSNKHHLVVVVTNFSSDIFVMTKTPLIFISFSSPVLIFVLVLVSSTKIRNNLVIFVIVFVVVDEKNTGFDLPRQQWSLLNCFRTEQGHCGACRRKWRLTDTDLCPCGETQTMSHIVESCPLTKLNGGLSRLHSADEDAVSWLTNYG